MTGISVPIPYIYKMEIKEPGDLSYRQVRYFEIIRNAAPILKLRRPITAASTIRLFGYGPFTHFTAISDTLDTYFPINAENLPVTYAVSNRCSPPVRHPGCGRTRGALDQREQANRPGTASAIAQVYLNRFYTMLERAAMPPMPPNVKSVL
jgi:hypothetical protein